MRIPKSLELSTTDIGFITWSSILFGMIFGAFFPKCVKRHIWVFISDTMILAILPIIIVCRFMQCEAAKKTPSKPYC